MDTWQYDGSGNPAVRENKEYNNSNELTKHTTFTFDSEGNEIKTKYQWYGVWGQQVHWLKEWKYDATANEIEKSETTYDENEHPTLEEITDAAGKFLKKTEWTYDGDGALTAKTETTYDENEHPTLEEVSDAAGKLLKKTEWTYDGDGAPTAKTETTYDENEHPTLEEVSDAAGKLLKKTEWTYSADGTLTDKTETTYGYEGQVIEQAVGTYGDDGETLIKSDITTFTDDGIYATDRQVTEYSDGVMSAFTDYDYHEGSDAGHIKQTTTTKYALDGETVVETEVNVFRGDGTTLTDRQVTTYSEGLKVTADFDYDDSGRPVRTETWTYSTRDGTSTREERTFVVDGVPSSEGRVTETEYFDGEGNRTKLVSYDYEGGNHDYRVHTYEYVTIGDAEGRLETDHLADYDDENQVVKKALCEYPEDGVQIDRISFYNPHGNEDTAYVRWVYTYESGIRTLAEEFNGSGEHTVTYYYDEEGRVTLTGYWEYDAQGRQSELKRYDSAGNLRGNTQWEYDSAGNLGIEQNWTRDSGGKVIEEQQKSFNPAGDTLQATTLHYFEEGHANYGALSHKDVETWEYDDSGNPTLHEVEEFNNSDEPTKHTIFKFDNEGDEYRSEYHWYGVWDHKIHWLRSWKYDFAGNELEISETTYDENEKSTLEEVTDATGKLLQKTEWAYDAEGNASGKTETTYDENEKSTLEEVTDAAGKLLKKTEWAYDAEGNASGKTETTYDENEKSTLGEKTDAAGKLLQKTEWAYDAEGNASGKTETTYDENEKSTLEEVTDAAGKLLQKTEWAYDAEGNASGKNRDHVRCK